MQSFRCRALSALHLLFAKRRAATSPIAPRRSLHGGNHFAEELAEGLDKLIATKLTEPSQQTITQSN